jgi:signal recognition particle GTPase
MEAKDRRERNGSGRRVEDHMQAIARQSRRTERALISHLDDCTNARKKQDKTLRQIKQHLSDQDVDLQTVRDLQRLIKLAMASIGAVAAALEFVRFFVQH